MSISNVELLRADGTIEAFEVEASTASPWTINVWGKGFDRRSFSADDLFNALIKWRREIDEHGGKLLCAGARRDVTPSGMSRSMGGARKAYVIKIGQPATAKVDIFDRAAATEIATVDEQKKFGDQWFESLREKLKR